MNVIKRDRSVEPFSSHKIIRACKKACCTTTVAKLVAAAVHKKAYNGITTSKIRKLVIARIRLYDPCAAKAFSKYSKRRR